MIRLTETSSNSSLLERVRHFMESQINLDPLIFFVDTTFAWTTNSVMCLTFWRKLKYEVETSWWIVSAPLWCYYWMSIPFTFFQLATREYLVQRQIGPPPSHHANIDTIFQYTQNRIEKLRQLVIKCGIRFCHDLGTLSFSILLFDRLERHGKLVVDGLSVNTIMMPIWLAWLCITILSNLSVKISSFLGIYRDSVMAFLSIIAFKLDGNLPVSWDAIFIIPWTSFSILAIFVIFMIAMMIKGDVVIRPQDFKLPRGITAIATSACMHYFSFLGMYYHFQGEDISLGLIFLPSCIAWIMMWISAIFTSLALYEKERELRSLMQVEDSGLTEIEQSRRMVASLTSKVHNRFDVTFVTDSQIAELAETMIEDEPKPSRLLRTGHNTFRSLDEVDLIEEGRGPSASDGSSSIDRSCFICCDAEGRCVLLECGHGLFCRSCANRLIVQRPHECPTCRQRITQIVEITPEVEIGQTINVE